MSRADEFVMSRCFKASREKMWKAWTTPELFAQWFGPKGVTTTLVSADIRPGGHLHCHMDLPGGGRLWAKLVYRAVDPMERLVWEHSFSDPDGNIAGSPFSEHWPRVLLTTVTFEDAGEDAGDSTRLRLHQVPLDASAEDVAEFRDAFESMRGGWSGNFDVLEDFLAGES